VNSPRLSRYFRPPRLRTREPFLEYLEKWVFLSALLGIATGVVVAIYAGITLDLWGISSKLYVSNMWLVVPVVVSGFLLSGFLVSVSHPAVNSGIEEVVEAYHANEKMKLSSFPLKMLASVATIASGGCTGFEANAIYAGGAAGTWLWNNLKRLKLKDDDRDILLLAGAAAGLGAVFKAPLTGIIFALEVPFKDDLAHDAVIPSLIASVSSYLTLIGIIGPTPLFNFPGLTSFTVGDIVASALLGAGVGLFSLAFMFLWKKLRGLLEFSHRRFYVGAFVGAAVISLAGLLEIHYLGFPYTLGVSYALIAFTTKSGVAPTTMILLFALEMLSAGFTLRTAGVGGLFVPLAAMGASLGAFFGLIFFPARVDLFVAAGLAAFVAAGYKTPLAAVTFVAETTAGPGYLIPALVSAAVSYAISGEISVSEAQRLTGEVDLADIGHLPVSDIMTRSVIAVSGELSLQDFVDEYLFKFQYKSFPVVAKDGPVGTISMANVRAVPKDRWFNTSVISACDKFVQQVYPDTTLQDALDVMYREGVGRLLVVSRANSKEVLGIVAKTDVINAVEKRRL